MVRRFLKFFVYFLFFICMLAIFIPKSNVYYLLEKQIEPYGVLISEEHLDERPFSLGVQNMHVSFKGLPVGVVEDAEISLLGFYNSITFEDIALASFSTAYIPLEIEFLEVNYTPVNPFVLQGKASGVFGSARMEFHLKSRELRLYVTPSEMMRKKYKNSLIKLKKLERGVYFYAKTL